MDDLSRALPELLTTYRRGLLVPFIGSGMSVPACRGWTPFVLAIAEAAGCEVPSAPPSGRGATDLYRLADVSVRRLHARGRARLAAACRQALSPPSGEPPAIPTQTEALAAIHWPLVLSTNYDDLLLRAVWQRREQARAASSREATWPSLLELAGQSVQDCHAILRSLDAVAPPMLWALQGYLGDAGLTHAPMSAPRVARLEREVVIGYQQYQTVINAQPHLRRAVAEVFRRRSLLFLGSGVQEDYLVNLIGEIIHHHGTNAHRHYAVFHRSQRDVIDDNFFRLRLGIQPLFVDDHAEIPAFLRRFKDQVRLGPGARRETSSGCAPHELAFRFHDGFSLRLRNDTVALPAGDHECVGVSVGRQHGRPLLGHMARGVLGGLGLPEVPPAPWQILDDEQYVFRHPTQPNVFLIAARHLDDNMLEDVSHDRRELLAIPRALHAFLAAIAGSFDRAHVGLLAAGSRRPWPALYPFVVMLSAIRRFVEAGPGRLRELTISVVDPGVWFPLLAGKIPVESLLSSDRATVWVHVIGDADDVETYAITIADSSTIAAVAAQCGLGPGRWHVSPYPMPMGDPHRVRSWGDLAVIPGSTVTFRAVEGDEAANFVT